MAKVYRYKTGWGEATGVDLNSRGEPVDTGYALCYVLYPRFTLDEPGNMSIFKHSSNVEYPYLVFLKDVDKSSIQVLIPDFESLAAFFQAVGSYSFLFAFEQNIAELIKPGPGHNGQ